MVGTTVDNTGHHEESACGTVVTVGGGKDVAADKKDRVQERKVIAVRTVGAIVDNTSDIGNDAAADAKYSGRAKKVIAVRKVGKTVGNTT
jgi:hypothetical protein